MAKPQFYSITFDFEGREPNEAAIKQAIDTALDWYRYAPNCWIVWSSKTAEEWAAVLRKKADKQDGIFICELNMNNRQGWMTEAFWGWLDKAEKKK